MAPPGSPVRDSNKRKKMENCSSKKTKLAVSESKPARSTYVSEGPPASPGTPVIATELGRTLERTASVYRPVFILSQTLFSSEDDCIIDQPLSFGFPTTDDEEVLKFLKAGIDVAAVKKHADIIASQRSRRALNLSFRRSCASVGQKVRPVRPDLTVTAAVLTVEEQWGRTVHRLLRSQPDFFPPQRQHCRTVEW